MPTIEATMNRPISVLLVEINETLRDSYRTFLNNDPRIKVIPVPTISTALPTMEQEKIDAVLIDTDIPDCKGPETVREIQDKYPNTAIIVITENPEPELQRKYIEAGAHDFVIKNVALSFMTELVNKVRRAVIRNEVRPYNPHRLNTSITKTDELLDSLHRIVSEPVKPKPGDSNHEIKLA